MAYGMDHLGALGFSGGGSTYLGPGANFGGRGGMSEAEAQYLQKALIASEGITDPLDLTSTGVLMPEELDTEVKTLTITEKHLTLWRDLQALMVPVNNTVHQFTVQTGHGTEANWTRQVELPLEADPDWQRNVGFLKILRTLYKVGDIASAVRTTRNLEAESRRSAMIRMMRTFEWSMIVGDSSLMPEWIDGFQTAVRKTGSPNHMIDMRGLAPTIDLFEEATLTLTESFSTSGSWRMYCTNAGRVTLDRMMRSRGSTDTIERFIPSAVGSNAYDIGSMVNSIKTGNGDLVPVPNLMMGHVLENSFPPVKGDPASPAGPVIEGATSLRAPNPPTVVVAPVAAPIVGSRWSLTDLRPSDGTTNYGYRVSAVNRWGKSIASAVVKAGGPVVAGGAIDVTITPAGVGEEVDYYEVYGQMATNDEAQLGRRAFTVIGRIKADIAGGPVTFRDLNRYYPRHTSIFIIDTTTTGPEATLQIGQLAGVGVVNEPLAKRAPLMEAYITMTAMPMYIAPYRIIEIYNVPVSRNASDDRGVV